MNLALIATATALISASTAAPSNPCANFAVISHRGLSALLPEESRPAYEASADLGADYLEMDVHRTKDNILIVNHDNTLARTTNIREIFPTRANDNIFTFTFDEVSKLKNKNVPIIKLEEVVDIALTHPRHPGLYIETKSPELYPGVEKQIVDLLQSKGAFKQLKVFFQSFDIESVKRFKALKPETPRLYLTEESYSTILKKDLPLAALHANGIGPNANEISLRKLPDFISKTHQNRLVVHFWTVDSPTQMKALIEVKADGAFTNRTDKLIEICGKQPISAIKVILDAYKLK